MSSVIQISTSCWLKNRRRIALIAAYVVAEPLLIGLVSGINQAGSARLSSRYAYIALYLFVNFGMWWLSIILTWLSATLLRPWKPTFVGVLVVGVVITNLLGAPYSLIWQPLFASYLAEGSKFFAIWPWRYEDPTYLSEALLAFAISSFAWVIVNLLFFNVFAMPLFGFQPPRKSHNPIRSPQDIKGTIAELESSSHSPMSDKLLESRPRIAARLPPSIGDHVIALEAEEHYTRVYTTKGSALIIYRFSDAIADMGSVAGARVHRSFWIRTDCIVRIERAGRSYSITLLNGLAVKVSRSYKMKFEELGLPVFKLQPERSP